LVGSSLFESHYLVQGGNEIQIMKT